MPCSNGSFIPWARWCILKGWLLKLVIYVRRTWAIRQALRSIKLYDNAHRLDDINSAIVHLRHAVDLCPPDNAQRASTLDQLSIAVRKRFDQAGGIEDLEEEITLHREALQHRSTEHPERVKSLTYLSKAIRVRFEMLGRAEDLQESIALGRESLTLAPPEHSQRSSALSSLATALCTNFEHTGHMDDLEEGIRYFQEILQLRPPGHPARIGTLSDLANSMRTRFRETGHLDDLEKAIQYGREAFALCPAGHEEHSLVIGNLAGAILTRFTQTGNWADVEESIKLNRQALKIQPPGHPDRPMTLGNLPVALLFRFNETGKMEDLEDSIQLFRDSLALVPEGHSDRAMALSNLSSAILSRYQQTGRLEDSTEGIQILRDTLELLPEGHPYRAESTMSLAVAVLQRYEATDKIDALEEAIDLDRQALEILSSEHTYRTAALNNYAGALYKRFEKTQKIEDLDKAIELNKEALALRPPGHPDHLVSLRDLAMNYLKRFETNHQDGDLASATKFIDDTQRNLPPEHPKYAEITVGVATVLLARYEADRMCEHLYEAFKVFDKAANHPISSIKSRFTAALEWISKARKFHDGSLLRAYSVSLTLLARFLVATPNVELQHKFLRSTSTIPKTLASDAAAAAIEAGHVDVAVEFLEQGRSMLWSEMRNFRPPLDRLREVNALFADELATLTSELEHQATAFETSSPLNDSPVPLDIRQKNYRLLTEHFEQLLSKIRKLKDFEDFLEKVPFQKLRSAAAEGPIIVINVSQHRSDGIIVRYTEDSILVPLKEANPDILAVLASSCINPYASTSEQDFSIKLRQVLQILWKSVVNPIAENLAKFLAPKARIWWCPTSYLCALPLHAAGPYAPRQRNLPDLYISSYTSTLSVLIAARSSQASEESPQNDLLIIGDAGRPGTELPSVKEEVQRIKKHVKSAYVVSGEDANKRNVLSCLPRYRSAHFACHGHRTPESFRSWFQLYADERLELLDVIKARLPHAELAYLSACHAAAVDVQGTPDEVIHLAGALQFCGYRSVIGTLWAMADVDGPDAADDFYSYILSSSNGRGLDSKSSAIALNVMTREMRKKKVPIDRWVNFLHIGA